MNNDRASLTKKIREFKKEKEKETGKKKKLFCLLTEVTIHTKKKNVKTKDSEPLSC